MSKGVFRPTIAEIDLGNLSFNLNSVKKFVGGDKLYMAIVKADAYGHGSRECTAALESAGADWFGVAIPEEGIQLRKFGIKKRILSLGGFWRGQESQILKHKITPVIFDVDLAESFDRVARARGIEADIHIKIDTGMGRVGVPFDETTEFAKKIKEFKNLKVEGMMTHFASAEDLSQNAFTGTQIERFNKAVRIFSDLGMTPTITDLANSPGAVAHPESGGNLVRLGGVIYGLGEDVLPQTIPLPELRPVMSLTTRIAFLKRVAKGSTLGYGRTFETKRDSLVATLPIGYQDGYMRSLSNKAQILVKGISVPVVGRISMDWTIIDVTDVPGLARGEKVTLIGKDGEACITAASLAKLAGTISYEVTCGIHRRVQRNYLESGAGS